MTRQLLTAIFLSLIWLPASAQTHCSSGEAVYFSCKIKGSSKIASLCGAPMSGSISGQETWLQYRFGKPGKPELVFPTSKSGSLNAFTFVHDRHNRGWENIVSFTIKEFSYAVTFDESTEDRKNYFYGVAIAPLKVDGSLPTTLSCRATPHGEFNWLTSLLAPRGEG